MRLYVFALYVSGMVYSSTASPSTTRAYKVFPSLSVSVLPFSLNTTLSLFIRSPFESSILAFSVMVCPALAVIIFSSSVIVAFPLVIVILVVFVRDDLYGFSPLYTAWILVLFFIHAACVLVVSVASPLFTIA